MLAELACLLYKTSMPVMQLKSKDGRVSLEVGEQRAILLMDGGEVATFAVTHEDALTATRAELLAENDPNRRLIAFRRSSPQARALLREHGMPYASADGELYIHAPPVHVEQPPARPSTGLPRYEPASPFAVRASRVSRWLLLNQDATPSIRELAAAVDLSESSVSRTVRALADDSLVRISYDQADARRRRVRTADRSALLAAFEQSTIGRRIRSSTWDVGSREIDLTLTRLRQVAKRLELPHAVGGLTGATALARVPEPAAADVWIRRDDLDEWADAMMAVPSSRRRGTITFRIVPDPWVLSLARLAPERQTAKLPPPLLIADPVQLFLDCRAAGERALEAADAIREEMRW